MTLALAPLATSSGSPALDVGRALESEVGPDVAARFLLVYFNAEGDLHMRRLNDHRWVNVSGLFGAAGNVADGISCAINALWPECEGATRRQLAVMGDVVSKVIARFGGIPFLKKGAPK